jgi:vitamin B12 transporter
MKKSIRLRARAFARASAPALSVLSLAVAASVQAQGIEINPVVISASRMEQPLSEVLSSVSVITRQDIEKSQAGSLADLIQGEAGFEFGRTGGPGATTSFFLRGQESKSVVILIDGVRAQTDGAGALTTTNLPLAQIESIEILRGNAGALYGESAIGGVINIQTRQGSVKPNAYGSITYGSRNTSSLDLGYGGRVDDYGFNVNAGQTNTDGFSAMNAQQNSGINPAKDGASSKFFSGRVDKKINADLKIGLRARLQSSATDYDSDWYTNTTRQQFKTSSDALGGFAKFVVNDQWVSTLDLSHSNFNYRDYVDGALTTVYGTSTPNGEYEGRQNAVRWSNSYQLSDQTVAHFGIDKLSEKFSQQNSYTSGRETLGYFAGLTSTLDKFTVQMNLRHDDVDVDRTASSVSKSNNTKSSTGLLGLGYQLNADWRLTSTVSSAFRAPTAYETYKNASLTPETHVAREAGVAYKSDQALAKLVYFETSTKDAIVYQNFSYVNVGELKNKGLEATLRANWRGHSVKASLVAQDPWNVSEQTALTRRARHYGSVDISRPLGAYDVGAKVYTSGARSDFNYSPYPAEPVTLSGYALWSFYASRKIDNEWTARVKLENAFDRQYQLAYGYNTPGRGIFATLQYQPK